MSDQIIKYKNYYPVLHKNNYISKSAWVIGNVDIKENVKILNSVVIRGDGEKIEIEEGCTLNKNSTVHVALNGTKIKKNCMIGTNSVIHACVIKSNVLVGNNCVIMDNSEIGSYSIIRDNCLVAPRKKIPPFSIVAGTPGKIVKTINKQEFLKYKNHLEKSSINNLVAKDINFSNFNHKNIKAKNFYIAPDLFSTANLILEDNSSIWFAVRIIGLQKEGKVVLGEGSNIQDNSTINTKGKNIIIGKRVTIGHNVSILGPIKIEDDAVIGIGSIIEQGTIVKKNAFVGANSYVKKNTIIPEDTIYTGSPASFFRAVKKQEKNYFSIGQKVYENLAIEYSY